MPVERERERHETGDVERVGAARSGITGISGSSTTRGGELLADRHRERRLALEAHAHEVRADAVGEGGAKAGEYREHERRGRA